MNKNEIISNAKEVLKRRYRHWDWRTTNGLAKEIHVDPEILLEVLSEHASSSDREITFLNLPSRKNMNILWGLVEYVGDNFNQRSMKREDFPAELLEEELIEPPYSFLSHNAYDSKKAIQLALDLNRHGVICWLFECHIAHEKVIINAVREAIRDSGSIIVFISRLSLGSLWVQKEFAFSYDQFQKPVFMILDGSDRELTGFMSEVLAERRPEYQLVDTFATRIFPNFSSNERADWVHHAFGFLMEIHEYIRSGKPLILYPSGTGSQHENMMNFDEALARLDWISG